MRPYETLNLVTGMGLVVGTVLILLGFLLVLNTVFAMPFLISGALFLAVSGLLIPGLRAIDAAVTTRQ